MGPSNAFRLVAIALSCSLLLTLVATSSADANAQIPSRSTSTFKLSPAKDRIDVTATVTVTNRIPPTVTTRPCPGDPGRTCRTTTDWYTDSFGFFPIQLGARGVEFSGPGVKARIDHKNDYYSNYIVQFAPIYRGQSRTFKVKYHVPAAGPRSPNRTRIGEGYAHFCWYSPPTDRGTATAILPRSSEPATRYEPVTTKRTKNNVVLRSKRKANMARFYACTDSFKPHKLIRSEASGPSGQIVAVEGWPEDPAWSAAITRGLEETLPRLEEIAGMPIPGDDVVIRQVAAQALDEYAGSFDGRTEIIRVSEQYDDADLVAHELAHAWFNDSTVKDTWISEGHAEWMASEASRRYCTRPQSYPGKGKPKIRDWQFMGVNPTQREIDVVDYQYAAACGIVQQVAWAAGDDRMATITRALLERTPKYGGTERKRPSKPDWREWLDAVDELGLVPAGRGELDMAEKLLLEYGVARPKELEGRLEARTRYHEALAGPLAEVMPIAVRDHMDDWRFAKALRALDISGRVMEDAVAAEAAGLGEVSSWIGPELREARSIDELRSLRRRVREDPSSFARLPETEPPATEEPATAEASATS